MEGDELSFSELILVALTALLASMAAASMPSAGLITIVMVLGAIGVPSTYIAVIVPVVCRIGDDLIYLIIYMSVQDWFLDRFRTVTNVFGNAVGAAVISHLCQHKLMDTPVDLDSLPDADAHEQVFTYPGGLTEVEFGNSQMDLSQDPTQRAASKEQQRQLERNSHVNSPSTKSVTLNPFNGNSVTIALCTRQVQRAADSERRQRHGAIVEARLLGEQRHINALERRCSGQQHAARYHAHR